MSIKGRRIAVGQIFQESHDFNPIQTQLDDFVIERGQESISRNWESGSTFGGILRHLGRAGVDIRPTIAARARPGGTVSRSAYNALKGEIIRSVKIAKPLDAVVLELHGGMTAYGVGSAEGDLVSDIRSVVGRDVVIAVGLDLHGNPTKQLLRAADIVTACKEHPHNDVVDAGERAAQLALATMVGEIKPVTVMAKLPFVLRGAYETHQRPLRDLHKAAREALAGAGGVLLDVSIFNVQPFIDVEGMGQAFIAITNSNAPVGESVVRKLALQCWAVRDEFVDNELDIDAVLAVIDEHPERRPFVVSDYGDRVLAGAPGDSIEILRKLIGSGRALCCAIPIYDPEVARAAIAAGVGATFRGTVGGKITPFLNGLEIEGKVVSISDGMFIQRGPYQGGQLATFGNTAVIQVGRNLIIATSLAGMSQDPAAFSSQGVDIHKLDFVVTKSGNHFKLNFRGVAEPIVAFTAGLSVVKAGSLPFRRAKFYPDYVLTDPCAEISFFPVGTRRNQMILLD
jgi:microcystin degradation protein MlrC